jgi:hypothetical protein
MSKKFVSLVAIALLTKTYALKLRDDDLFTDDADTETTLQSIKAAEKIHK